MALWRFFNISGGYFEPVTSRWSVRVELLETNLGKEKSLSGGIISRFNVPDMSDVTTVNSSGGQDNFTNGSEQFNQSLDGKLSMEISAIFILLYIFTTFLAIFGNITAIIVFTKGKRSRTDLRPFLLNLAFADLIMAIFCIPFTFTSELLGNWVFSKPMCPIVVFLQTVSVTASVSTNMAVGIDRFYAITFPLKARITSSKYKIVIVVIWIFAVSLSAVQLKVCRAVPKRNSHNVSVLSCEEQWEDNTKREIYTLFILFLTYIIPLTILTFTYSIVGCILWKRTAPGNSDVVRDQMQDKAKLKVTLTVITITHVRYIHLQRPLACKTICQMYQVPRSLSKAYFRAMLHSHHGLLRCLCWHMPARQANHREFMRFYDKHSITLYNYYPVYKI